MYQRSLIVSMVVLASMALAPVALAAASSGAEREATEREGAFSMTEVYFSVGMAASAAFTASISILAAGMAVGKIGAAALGSAAEHPELLTRSLLFVALAEGLAVLGFAVAMLIVMKIP